jgi:TetR/AcrR family transcriptional repressor of nem operon
MAAAGLTHGGFYRHFASKDQLVAEACVTAVDSVATMFEEALARHGKNNGLKAAAASYLSARHRDGPSDGCPFAALASELVRADGATRAKATVGLKRIVNLLAGGYAGQREAPSPRCAVDDDRGAHPGKTYDPSPNYPTCCSGTRPSMSALHEAPAGPQPELSISSRTLAQ